MLVFIFSGVMTIFLPDSVQMLTIMLAITTLSLLLSTISRINRIEKTFELGMYFILVFSMVVASMARVDRLIDISTDLIMMITFTIFGTLFLHTLFSRIFRIDADTVMVTSTALICSPPFVPVIAGSLRNKDAVIGGLTVGIIGYAIGNYLGVIISYLIKLIL